MMGFSAFALVACWASPVMGLSIDGPQGTVSSLLSFDEEAAKNRPVTKVITLLKDMLKQMEKENEEDEAIYDKMACWCETNDKEKTKSIADAEARISQLTTTVEELTAGSARLNTEMQGLSKEVAADQKALDAATNIRKKQLAEFNGEEKDLLESVSALKAGITILGKHNEKSMLQVPKSHLLGVAATLEHEMTRHSDLLAGLISPSERRTIGLFVQSPEDFFDAAPALNQEAAQPYAPQGGEIFGILSQMKETFETNLAASQKEEMANQKSFEELKAAKEVQIEAAQAQIDTKTQELASTDEKNAQAKQDSEDTQASLEEDQAFLGSLKEKCAMTDSEWQERQKTRQSEMAAVSKALHLLSGDDAHDLFTKTFNAAFLQTQSVAVSHQRQQAAKILEAAAAKVGNPRLSALANRVQLDAFSRVSKAIDNMVVQLRKEGADEIKHKDFCVDEFNTNQLQTEKKTRAKSDVLAKIEDLESTIKTVSETIAVIKSEIAELSNQIKRAGEDRKLQNKEFQMTVADQRATQKLLVQAVNVLNSYYSKKAAAAALLQKGEQTGPPPPPGFKSYSNNQGGAGVTGLLMQIINDAKAMEAEAIHAEQDGQNMYEGFVSRSNKSLAQKNKDIVHKSKVKAKAEAGLVQAHDDKDAVLLELEQLSNYNAQLHGSCDFITKNFEIRQTARKEEMDALKQAKAILSGAKFTDFLQELAA